MLGAPSDVLEIVMLEIVPIEVIGFSQPRFRRDLRAGLLALRAPAIAPSLRFLLLTLLDNFVLVTGSGKAGGAGSSGVAGIVVEVRRVR